MSMTTPCVWSVSYLDCEEGTGLSALPDLPKDSREAIEQTAISLLWEWSGRQYGICPVTVRPCRITSPHSSTYSGRGPFSSWSSLTLRGETYMPRCGVCVGDCACALEDGSRALLLDGPVAEVSEVQIDGEVLQPSAYELRHSSLLIRQDGGTWPLSQDLLSPNGAPGTFSITYLRGEAVPIGGQLAAGRLAMELGKAYCNDSSCQLPERLQTITRQGITVGFTDQFEGLSEGRVGIWVIDSWVQSVRSRPSVGIYSPDASPAQRISGRSL